MSKEKTKSNWPPLTRRYNAKHCYLVTLLGTTVFLIYMTDAAGYIGNSYDVAPAGMAHAHGPVSTLSSRLPYKGAVRSRVIAL